MHDDLKDLGFVSNTIELKEGKKYLMVFKGVTTKQLEHVMAALGERGVHCFGMALKEGQDLEIIETPDRETNGHEPKQEIVSATKPPFNYREDPILGHTYTLTWNPAKRPIFSVITIVDRDTGRVAVYDHDDQSDYRSRIIRVLALAYKYNQAEITMDTTGIGDLLFEMLKEAGVAVKAIASERT